MQTWRLLVRPRMVAIIGPPDKINYTMSQQVVSNPYVQQPNSSNIIKIIQFVAYRYVVTISSKYNIEYNTILLHTFMLYLQLQ